MVAEASSEVPQDILFSKEALMMLQAGNHMGMLAYVGISVLAGIVLVAAGYFLAR